MSRVPQRDEIWKHKEDGYLARITYVTKLSVYFFDNQDGSFIVDDMENSCDRVYFEENFIFIGDGKPLSVLFEVQDGSI
jgi:hypothetical protein